jgi:hypothetical protein
VNERGDMMNANIKKHGISCIFFLFIVISYFILSPYWLFGKEADAASIQSAIPVPTGQQTYSHPLTATPAFISNPALAQPIAVGPFSEGGDTLSIQIGLNQFTEAVNMYGAYTVSTNPTTAYVLNSDLSFRAYSINTIAQALVSGTLPVGVEPLRENITSLFYETFFTMSITDIVPGIYNLYLLLTPADSIQTYYLWKTTLTNTGGHQLSIDKVGSGTVTSLDGLINCGTDCSELYNDEVPVTLSAFPADGYSFDRWTGCNSISGNTCSVTMTSNRSVTAIFIVNTQAYTLTVNKNGTGSGTVTSTPPGINCGSDCFSFYSEGTPVSLTATPASGSIFEEWTGCDNVFSNTCQITMSSNRSVTSTFTHEGGGGGGEINYIPIHLTQSGATYDGSLTEQMIGPNPGQEFYSVTRPAACNSMMQIAIAGDGPANPDMLVSSSDFGTADEALTLYQDFLNTTGYEVNTVDVIGGTTYWYWFAASFESEYVPIFPPSDSTYYIEVVNADSLTVDYRIEAHCW